MGRFAADVNAYLRETLASDVPALDWTTEHYVAGTPVDVAGTDGERLVAVELEWRRADPANNVVKLFRKASEDCIEAESIVLCQLFTRYYELQSGGHDSKRTNAEFIRDVAADRLDALAYQPVTFDLDPPKRGGERPDEWRAAADGAAAAVVDALAENQG